MKRETKYEKLITNRMRCVKCGDEMSFHTFFEPINQISFYVKAGISFKKKTKYWKSLSKYWKSLSNRRIKLFLRERGAIGSYSSKSIRKNFVVCERCWEFKYRGISSTTKINKFKK